MPLTQHNNIFKIRGRAAAFTLLELVVVIAILAILSLVAVRSLSGVEDQTRFDATQRQLAAISSAVVGNQGVPPTDASGQMFSFVSDNGRLPLAFGADPTTQLQELWSNPNNLPALAVRQAIASDPDVWLSTGWRGGYLQLGIGQTSLVDGWANPYDLFYTNASGMLTTCGNGNPVEIVRSRGADGQVDTVPTTGFNADQSLVFYSTAPFETTAATNLYLSNLTGNVYFYDPNTGQVEPPNPANGNVVVTLFEPGSDPTTNYIATQTITVTPVAPSTSFTYSFTNVPVGQRVLRAYQYERTGQPPVGTLPAFRSIPVRLIVQPGAQTQDLTMLSATVATTQPSTPGN